MSAAFNHVGLCVSDLERARRFYEELLGFEYLREINPPDDATSKLLRLPQPVGMTACYLRRDGFTLELLHYAGEAAKPSPGRERLMNEPGLTHISVSCDVDVVLGHVADYGGEVLDDTNIGAGVFIRDPDGQLIELLTMSYRESLDAEG
jgi:catechol 2,3-dioxygenase-like lactoylglutathione lyase family enzyme